MEEHGLTPAALETQLKNFREGFPFLPVTRAASCGDGIRVLDAAGIEQAAARYDRAKESLRVVKFVPASGAATRMFKDLFEFVREGRRTAVVGELLANRRRFAFWPELRTIIGDDADELRTVENIVAEGLRYGETPKGLVSFHRYGDEVRKAVEEHLVEGAQYAAAGGEVLIRNVIPKHLDCITAKLEEMGVEITEYDEAIRVVREKPLAKCNIKTMPHPGFPTDMQPQIAAVLCLADGTSIINENVWDNRFRYVEELRRLGAQISVDGKIAVIEGVKELVGAPVKAMDLRAGAAMVVAGLAARGVTEIENIEYIERGYENIVEKLQGLGADIRRVYFPEASVAQAL